MFTKISSFFKSLLSAFSLREKSIIGITAIVAIASGSILIYQNYFSDTRLIPTTGGIYREGIVSQKNSDLTDTINRLTKIGLIKFDADGKIIPAAASSWEISDDAKTYVFTISDKFSRNEILAQLQKERDKFAGINIESQDNNKIKFTFPQSYSPFLAEATEPVLDYGAFKLEKETSSEITLIPRENFYLGKPYLEKLVLKIYPDRENLIKAFKAGEIDGVFDTFNETWQKIRTYQFKLPRYNIAFFNTAREVLSNKETRKKIVHSEKFDNGIKLMLVSLDSPKHHQIVEDLLATWHDQNIQVDVYFKSADELTNNIIPKRDYDVLVYGLDYGRDPDPYPFWHSTQAGEAGLNLSNFSNIDADKALEEARQTKDPERRKQKLAEFQKYFDDEIPAIIISQDQWQFAVSDKIKGIETGHSITPADRFNNVDKWYIKEKRVKK